MWEWTIKKAERWRIDAFELWCWRRQTLESPRTSRKSNQSILKEINPEYSLEGLMLKLELQSFGHLIQTADSLEKTDAGRDWSQKEKGMTEDEMIAWYHWLNGHGFEQALGVDDGQGGLMCCSPWGRWWTGRPGVLQPMGSHGVRHTWVTGQQQRLKCSEQGTVREEDGRRGYGVGTGVVLIDLLGEPLFSTLESRVLTIKSLFQKAFAVLH